MRAHAHRIVIALLVGSGTLSGQTPLVTVNLSSGVVTRIDDGPAKDAMDAQLDAALHTAVGNGASSFSTHELDRIYERLLADLRRERPRSPATLLLFVYPGRIGPDKLKTLSEVFVDLELVIDPCDRSVCRASVGKHIELVGRAVGSRAQNSARYKLVFRTLLVRTVIPMHGHEVEEFRVPIAECISAAKKSGGGAAWLERRGRAVSEYEPLVAKEIAREAQHKGLTLSSTPKVHRTEAAAQVTMVVRGSRTRLEHDLLGALAAASLGLRKNPATPAATEIEVEMASDIRGQKNRRFRAPGQPVAEYLEGRLGAQALLHTYVSEARANVQAISFEEDSAKAAPEPAQPSDEQAVSALSGHFDALRGCVSTEAQRNPRFSGVTLLLQWQPSGRALLLSLKEPGLRGGSLQSCLFHAVGSIPLPRFSGAARTIEFPMLVKR